jgi:hypothetical protein
MDRPRAYMKSRRTHMQPSNLKILQGILFLLFSASSITYLLQNDYSNWSIFMLLAFMILSAEPEETF